MAIDADHLESLYRRYTTRAIAAGDPVRVMYRYGDPLDREVAGLVGSCLAYGRVEQAMLSIDRALAVLGDRPAEYIAWISRGELRQRLAGFKHRMTTAEKLTDLLSGAAGAIRRFGSLEACFAEARRCEPELLPAAAWFCHTLDPERRCDHLLANPSRRSACKRLHLFLRWMVRRDAVDVGHWRCIDPAELLMPIDTHLLAWAQRHGATNRKQADEATAREVTAAVAAICPADPVKYDFCLAHAGMDAFRER